MPKADWEFTLISLSAGCRKEEDEQIINKVEMKVWMTVDDYML